jgi:hypothetical protein
VPRFPVLSDDALGLFAIGLLRGHGRWRDGPLLSDP